MVTMDFALFMERYGYKLLLVVGVVVAFAIILGPFIVSLYKFKSLGILVGVVLLIGLAIRGLGIGFGKFVSDAIYAHRQSPMKKNVRRLDDKP
ncbi:hypothetical protein [Thermococcus sp. 21S9]|uniref:hypothetical protein n=1 Tax=Thermococcus sp. 21S9 TaxID=1638223 RepID=UPI00143C8BA7|nr:hypothetical protein [Thermococcus sp. 21S9]